MRASQIELHGFVSTTVSSGSSLKKKHNLNLSMVVVNRESDSEGGAQAFTEFTGTLGYSYNFSSR